MTDYIINILSHEYFLAFIGVVAWHFEIWRREKNKSDKLDEKFNHRKFFSKEWDDIVRSMFWVGLAIAFDDELLEWYNGWAEVDYAQLEKWMYFVGGFSIDRIVQQFKGEKSS